MIAIHAWRSSASIRKFRELYPDRPLIVALSGTDVYDYINRDPTPTLRSLACADRLVALQELVRRRIHERRPERVGQTIFAGGSPHDVDRMLGREVPRGIAERRHRADQKAPAIPRIDGEKRTPDLVIFDEVKRGGSVRSFHVDSTRREAQELGAEVANEILIGVASAFMQRPYPGSHIAEGVFRRSGSSPERKSK